MILIKNLLGMLQIEVILSNLAPWKIQHELDIVILDAVVRRRRIIPLKLGDLSYDGDEEIGEKA